MNPATANTQNSFEALASSGVDTLRAYEDAAAAIGRLDATAKLTSDGLRELLVLRCIATPVGANHIGMIALVRPDGEGESALRDYGKALRAGAARARGGGLWSVASLYESLGRPPAAWPAAEADDLLRDARERTPPVLKAARIAIAVRSQTRGSTDTSEAQLLGLAVTLILCLGGATTDAWITLPRAAAHADSGLGATFAALAREARATERGLEAARELGEHDELRVRSSLGRAAYSALDVLALLRSEIVITVPGAARALSLTPPTAGAAVTRLVELGIAREVTGRERSRAFAYEGLVRALEPESVSGK